jgi:magnesium chelatase subunit D
VKVITVLGKNQSRARAIGRCGNFRPRFFQSQHFLRKFGEQDEKSFGAVSETDSEERSRCFCDYEFRLVEERLLSLAFSAKTLAGRLMKKTHAVPHTSYGRKNHAARRPAGNIYPFSAIVGQVEIKLALILNVIDPGIGGVLMMGHRGTGKSTAVRALADLLPEIRVSSDCYFNCEPSDHEHLCAGCDEKLATHGKLQTKRAAVPVVDLPLGATEDRVCGSIDIHRALREGVKSFEPGLLARANRGFLYIDEVNLLEDHLVDLLLDVAVTGRNKVERENISVEHPAQFVLIGSGNPEEGELRPQLLDRFGLYIEVTTENDVEERVEILARREAFDRNSVQFCASFAVEQKKVQQRIARARRSFINVKVGRPLLRQIATLCSELKVDGHRGELTIMRSARALAAFAGRKSVSEDDVRRVAAISLRHRLRRDPLSDTAGDVKIEQTLDNVFGKQGGARSSASSAGDLDGGSSSGKTSSPKQRLDPNGSNGSDVAGDAAGAAVDSRLPALSFGDSSLTSRAAGSRQRRARTGSRAYNSSGGRYVRATAQRSAGAKVALDATLRLLIGAGHQLEAARGNTPQAVSPAQRASLIAESLRFKSLSRKQGTLFIFAIDTSGSMALNRIGMARGAILRLLQQSYVNRDRVAIVSFRGTRSESLLSPSRSMTLARRVLDSLSVGGGTPLSAALACSLGLAEREARQHDGDLVLLLFTDGGANVPLQTVAPMERLARDRVIADEIEVLGAKLRSKRVQTFVVETQGNFASRNKAESLAAMLGARHVRLRNTESDLSWKPTSIRLPA